MKIITRSNAALAAAALTLAVTGAGLVSTTASAAEGKVMCQGVNACKGQGACKTASNSCAGQAACKGQAWIHTTSAQCKKWGGTILG
jgi:hypothetical protein